MIRATQRALVQIRKGGESPFDLLQQHEDNGEPCSEFTIGSGAQIEITTQEGFTCVHLREECANIVDCPVHQCPKFSGAEPMKSMLPDQHQ